MNVQIIKENNKPAFAVISYSEFEQIASLPSSARNDSIGRSRGGKTVKNKNIYLCKTKR